MSTWYSVTKRDIDDESNYSHGDFDFYVNNNNQGSVYVTLAFDAARDLYTKMKEMELDE